jgi:hypothetical protein
MVGSRSEVKSKIRQSGLLRPGSRQCARQFEVIRRPVELGLRAKKMNVDGLRELDEMAAKLESTIQRLPAVKRDELLRDLQRIRAQLTALLSASKAGNSLTGL